MNMAGNSANDEIAKLKNAIFTVGTLNFQILYSATANTF